VQRKVYHRHGKVSDVSRSTFNEIGPQHSCYNTLVVHHHRTFTRGMLDNPGLGINTEVVTDDCKPAHIMSTTTFRTTNVSVVAPYFANLDFNCRKDQRSVLYLI